MHTDRLVARVEQLEGAVDRVLSRGETAGDDRLILQAVKEARANVETLSRIGVMGDLERRVALLEQLPTRDEGDGDDDREA
ncbi:MAG TPA: hypothetical protein VE338_08275 [Ktedonobacterales bacterium]|jgi:hypothetical protein|nr:hypothetical protein [Ktedonobacterales bacterium]